MLIGIDKNEVCEFISSEDAGESKTVFLVGTISNSQKMAMVGDVVSNDGNVNNVALQKEMKNIVKAGLRGVKNFYDKTLNKAVDITNITDEFIEYAIPFAVLYELAGKIIQYNFEMAALKKN